MLREDAVPPRPPGMAPAPSAGLKRPVGSVLVTAAEADYRNQHRQTLLLQNDKLRGLSPRPKTERPRLVGEVSANFFRIEGATWSG
jgi:hypothetical protein